MKKLLVSIFLILLINNIYTKGFPEKVLGAYLCTDKHIDSAQQIVDSGFNVIYSSFYDISVSGGKMVISPNKCCEMEKPYALLQELKALGVTVLLSSGGDGCQGSAPSGLTELSDAAIVQGLEDFKASTGVDWDGIDIDWESSNANSLSDAINRLGRALRPKGYSVTAVPMSSQFVPGGIQGWTSLNPADIDVVAPQWYQGGCVGTQSCPCWGTHQVADMDGCPGFTQSYMQQAKKCSINQWVQGFKKVGSYSWSPNQILIGAKSWCGGDTPQACAASDTGIWGYTQMINILSVTGARGAYFWDLNDYYDSGYFTIGKNPINDKCKWANQIATYLGLDNDGKVSNDVDCQNYPGPLAQNCLDNPWLSAN